MKALLTFKALKILVLGAPVLLLAVLLHFYLPQRDVVVITGTEVRRIDQGRSSTSGEAGIATRDVFVIFAKDFSSGDVRVYENQDTRWGFPFYFKFNSADVQAQAQNFATTQKPVAITHYGWRINIFSMFPNATAVEEVDPNATLIPWFNIVLVTLLFGGFAFIWRVVSRFFARRRA